MKALIAGLGSIGQRHLRNLRALLGNRVEILAYRVRRQTHVLSPSMNSDASRNVEKEYSISVFDNLDSALAERPNVVFVCNPTSLHLQVALASVRAGCDVFIEKPVSNSLDGTCELVRAAADLNQIVMIGYQWRFHPCLRKFADTLGSGILGKLLAVRATIGEYLPNWHPYEDYRQMYASRSDQGGGVVLSQIHECDYLYSLFGLPKQIYAIGGHWSELEIDVEDTASVLMECRVDHRPLPIHLQQDYLQAPPTRNCEVVGDRGRALMDLMAMKVVVIPRDNPIPEEVTFPGFERNQLFIDQLCHFLDCVKTRKKPVVDLTDGLQSLRMALAIKKSMETHAPVDPASLQ